MRRICRAAVSMLLAVVLLISTATEAEAATVVQKKQIHRDIAIVFDNSGSMYIGDKDQKRTWCYATYAMEISKICAI